MKDDVDFRADCTKNGNFAKELIKETFKKVLTAQENRGKMTHV